MCSAHSESAIRYSLFAIRYSSFPHPSPTHRHAMNGAAKLSRIAYIEEIHRDAPYLACISRTSRCLRCQQENAAGFRTPRRA